VSAPDAAPAPPRDVPPAAPVRVIGVGNELAGDAAAGVLVARGLEGRLAGRASIIEAGSVGLAVLDLMAGARAVILVDAVRSGAAAGLVHRLDASAGSLGPVASAGSTHALGVLEAVELGRALGSLPLRLVVYGIEAGDTRMGAPLTPAVTRAVDEAIARIAREVEGIGDA
jgi:hydrogenase maturation protease